MAVLGLRSENPRRNSFKLRLIGARAKLDAGAAENGFALRMARFRTITVAALLFSLEA